jgi:hypothetical protein
MKHVLPLPAFVCAIGQLCAADAPHDLAEARKRYDVALAAAVKPVREHFLQELLALKSRAMALKDFDLATAVEKEVKSLGTNEDLVGDKADFKSQLLNTTWTWVHSWEHMTFREKGVATIGTDGEYKWRLTNPTERVIEGTFGHNRTFKFTFSADMKTAKGVVDGSTKFDSVLVAAP